MKHATKPTTKPTQRELFGTWLAHLTRAWREQVDARLAPFGLSQARWLILLHLSRGANGSSQKALAARVGVQGPTLVRTLDRLEAEGMVERREASEDRRAKTIHVTAKAEPAVQRIQSVADKVREEILAGISDAALADCVRVFERIAANLGTDRIGTKYAAKQTSHKE